MFSPAADSETFSTPPSSPFPPSVDHNVLDRPSLSRRSSRPSNLRIQQSLSDYKPHIVVDNGQSPDASTLIHNTMSPSNRSTPLTAVPPSGHTSAALAPTSSQPMAAKSPILAQAQQAAGSPMRSPCFVHSHLQGPSFTDWLKGKHQKTVQEARIDGPPKARESVHPLGEGYPDGSATEPPYENGYAQPEEDDEETASSLTKQLAETAIGVREMSKQLRESPCIPDPTVLLTRFRKAVVESVRISNRC